jgi:hypothetical protein
MGKLSGILNRAAKDPIVKVLALLMTALVALLVPHAAVAAQVFLSNVTLVPDGATQRVEIDDSTTALLVFTGTPFTAHITYYIGWSEMGQNVLQSKAITNPEFAYFCTDSDPNCNLSTHGLGFNPDTGVIIGTLFQPTQVAIRPGVRDKVSGERPYRGDGFWFTSFVTSSGKTWFVESKPPSEKILILAKPDSAKQVHLLCSLTPVQAGGQILLNIDYDIGKVEWLGPDGKIAGIYTIDPNSTILGWSSSKYSGVTLDRTSGAFSATVRFPSNGITQANGQCEQRSTTTKF